MYCDAPTVAVRIKGINPYTGKHYKPFKFFRYQSDEQVRRDFVNVEQGYESLLIPCGKCLLCTKRYRMQWVLRCMCEARLYDQMCYLTLTCDDEHVDDVFPSLSPSYVDGKKWNSLCHKPFQDFMKRLRRQLSYGYHYDEIVNGKPVHRVYKGEPNKPLRFFMCGEYGDNTHRPHYHAIVFGFWPPDAQKFRGSLYVSDMIGRRWPFGFHTVGKVEPDSISYVAGYVDKKMDGERMTWATERVNPEYVCMSRGCSALGTGGIGRGFFDQYYKEIYPLNDDGTFARNYAMIGVGTKVKVPRYFDELLDLRDAERYDKLMAFREQVGVSSEQEFELDEWLNESHRRCAVAVERRRQRDPGVTV